VPFVSRSDHVRDGFWYRWSRQIQRHPVPAAALGLTILVVMALPVFAIQLGSSDASSRPTRDTTRRAYDLLAEGFGPGFNGPLLLATKTPNGDADLAVLNQLTTKLNQTKGVAFATPPQANAEKTVAVQQVFPTTDPQAKATADLVNHLRDDVIPSVTDGKVAVKVGGLTAAADDFASYTAARLPIFMGAVLLLSFLLLMVVFRSVLVPLKAVIMNLLSIGAAYGVMVAVFQWGWLGDAVGVSAAPIEPWAPMMLFAIVFGLSMDYEVFLLSSVRERYDATGDNATAVAGGLGATARVITAAAAIMVFVFGSFVFADVRALKLIGVGLAVAVAVDATVVRVVLVPATMELLGRANWWMPRWLARILPTVDVDGGHPSRLTRPDPPRAWSDEREREGAYR
ncbi:MAG TPA: MMPL family transporter, partial [Acidimicrobiales bacterium]|nr:MMPL family transporter [Acidimicrobiales bacterium]